MSAGDPWAPKVQTAGVPTSGASLGAVQASRDANAEFCPEQKPVTPLGQLLAQELAVCAQLQELADQEERALLESDVEALSQVLEQECRLTERLLLLEEARVRQVEEATVPPPLSLTCASSASGADLEAHRELIASLQRLSATVITQMRLLRQAAAVQSGLLAARASGLAGGGEGESCGAVIECRV